MSATAKPPGSSAKAERSLAWRVLRSVYHRFNRRLVARIEELDTERRALLARLENLTEGDQKTVQGVLNDVRFMAHHMLRRGDLEGAAYAFRCAKHLGRNDDPLTGQDQFLAALVPVVKSFTDKRPALADAAKSMREKRVAISLAAWGDDYIDVFVDLLIPSLLAPGNLPALAKESDIVFYVVTTKEGRQRIEQSSSYGLACRYARFEFLEFPTALAEAVTNDYGDGRRYWLYGALQQVTVLYAGDANMDLLLMTPDTVYSENALSHLVALTEERYDAVLMTSVRTVRGPFGADLRRRIDSGGVLSMSSADLLGTAMRHVHSLHRRCFLYPDNTDFLVGHVNLYWEVPGGVIVHAPHLLPAIVSRRALKRGLHIDYYTIDTNLIAEAFSTDEQREKLLVLPTLEDAAYVELSPDDREAPPTNSGFPYKSHGRDHFWRHCGDFNLWIFRRRLFIPSPVQPGIGLRAVDDVDRELAGIIADIECQHPSRP